jgi:hypothetical protein
MRAVWSACTSPTGKQVSSPSALQLCHTLHHVSVWKTQNERAREIQRYRETDRAWIGRATATVRWCKWEESCWKYMWKGLCICHYVSKCREGGRERKNEKQIEAQYQRFIWNPHNDVKPLCLDYTWPPLFTVGHLYSILPDWILNTADSH